MGPTRSISEKLQGLLLRCTLHVRVGSLASFEASSSDVSYYPERRHSLALQYLSQRVTCRSDGFRPQKQTFITTIGKSAKARKRLMHRRKQCLYSITSSARAENVGGTLRPSTFAVFRLRTNSKLVDWTVAPASTAYLGFPFGGLNPRAALSASLS
jgi:hypothetical protein